MNYEEQMVEMIKGGGCFVSTRLGLYRANKRLTAEELGIEELPKKVISLGSMKLLPDEICPEMKIVRSIENRVNGLVNLRTFEFEGFGRYLKNVNSEVFATELEELREEFNQVVDLFEQNYHSYISASVDFWGEHADSLSIPRFKLEEAVRDSFIPPHELRSKFKFLVTYLQIPDPAKDAWKNAEVEYQELSQTFLEETMRQLRYEAVKAMEDMAAAISAEKWSQKTLNKIPKMLERIEQMQLVEDDELADSISRFRDQFITMEAKDFKKEDGAEALTKLQEGLASATGELKELAQQDMKEAVERKMSAGGGRRINAFADDAVPA